MGRRVWLIPTGGLCNRLQVLLSGELWAADAGRSFRLWWSSGDDFGARFEDLFENEVPRVPSLVVRAAGQAVGYWKTAWLADPSAVRSPLLIVCDGVRFRDRDGEPFDVREPLANLRPTRAVVDRIRATPLGPGPVVGVFIRAHSDAHREAVRASPPAWFFHRMDEIRTDRPDVEFFLSTDSPAVSAEVHRRFDRVHEQRDKGKHNSAQALVASVADLYLLASTSYIVGSHGSSFTRMAGWMSAHGVVETSEAPPAVSLATSLLRERLGAPVTEPRGATR